MTFHRAPGAMAAFFLTAALFHPAPSRADVVFDFSGVCTSGCTGTATGVLTLADSYAFGTDILFGWPDFISFAYSSSSSSFEIAAPDFNSDGGINADGSFNWQGILDFFTRAPIGPVFTASAANAREFEVYEPPNGEPDFGTAFTFTLVSGTVPEPSTWAMMLLGFAGLGYGRYRKARQAAAASA